MNETEDLIRTLASDGAPVRRSQAPFKVVGQWLTIAVPAIILFTLVMGVRPDLGQFLRQPRNLLDLSAALATVIGAAWAAIVSALPGRPAWQQALPAIPALAWTGLLAQGAWSDPSPMRADLICLPAIAMSGLLPCVALIVVMRRGLVLAPCLGMFLAVSASASLAYVGLRLIHPEDAGRMVLVWQFGPVLLLSTLMACLGERIFPPKFRKLLGGDSHSGRSAS